MKNPVRLFILMALPLIGVTTIKAEGDEKTEEEEKFFSYYWYRLCESIYGVDKI